MAALVPEWATKEPCLMGIDEAGRGPVLGPMVYGCMYCAYSYNNTLATLKFADSKTLKEEQREELFESLKVNSSIRWEVDVICPKDISAKMLKKKSKVNLNEISHNSAMGLVRKVLRMGVLLAEVYVDTVGDPEKYRTKLTEKFIGIKFVVAKKADSLYPVISGASIVAKVTRDRALRNWVFDETALSLHMRTRSGYLGDPDTKRWLEDHKHLVFGFFKDAVDVTWESDKVDQEEIDSGDTKRQVKLLSLGFTGFKRKTEEIESTGKGCCKFFQVHKLELVRKFP
uniref:Ribonuclease n=1 Tax=Zea mays TaxID=4577 RepID=B6UB68_MAIZE|nr:ribonuclease HI large subunit [Zea mays]